MACNHLPSVRCAECQSAGPYLGDPGVAIEILKLRIRELEEAVKWALEYEMPTDDTYNDSLGPLHFLAHANFKNELRRRAGMNVNKDKDKKAIILDIVRDQMCECYDDYGRKFSVDCWRCRILAMMENW